MNYMELDTPSLIIDQDVMMENIHHMQNFANKNHVTLRPHTKTHKIPELALLQEKEGAKGIAVAKTGEAEVMAAHGLKDIFIANEIVGKIKYQRIIKLLQQGVKVTFGLDSIAQADLIEESFKVPDMIAQVLIEIEVGENRSGVIEETDFRKLIAHVQTECPHVEVVGVFSHDGNSYNVSDLKACKENDLKAQRRTLKFAALGKELGANIKTVSIGSTPSLMQDFPILEGVTELRPGTYILMDASQANAYGDQSTCAATVLATVMSLPTPERIILDVGAKGITMQSRTEGICAVKGLGYIKQFPDAVINEVFDEHAIIYNKHMHDNVKVGDKVEIVMVHICPVMNLQENAYLVSKGEVLKTLPVLCRGKLQ